MHKRIIGRIGLHQDRKLFFTDTIEEMKSQGTNWEKIPVNHIYLIKLSKKTNNPITESPNDLNRYFNKGKYIKRFSPPLVISAAN